MIVPRPELNIPDAVGGAVRVDRVIVGATRDVVTEIPFIHLQVFTAAGEAHELGLPIELAQDLADFLREVIGSMRPND